MINNNFPVNSRYQTSSSDEAENSPIEKASKSEDGSQRISQQRLLIDKACMFSENILKTTVGKADYSYTLNYIRNLKFYNALKSLSSCNILFVDIQKNIIIFSKDLKFSSTKMAVMFDDQVKTISVKEALDNISINLQRIFIGIRNQSQLSNIVYQKNNDNTFITNTNTKTILIKLNSYLKIFNSFEIPSKLKEEKNKLNENLKHISNIVYDKKLLDEASNPLCSDLSPEESCLEHPIGPEQIEFYKDSLEATIKSFCLYKQSIESSIKNPIEECLKLIKNNNTNVALKNLSLALQNYLTSLSLIEKILFLPVENLIKNSFKDPALKKICSAFESCNHIEQCDEIVSQLESVFSCWAPILREYSTNQAKALSFINTGAEKVAEALKQIQKRSALPKSLRNKFNHHQNFLNTLSETRMHLGIIDDFFSEPFSIPMKIFEYLSVFGCQLKTLQNKAWDFQNSIVPHENKACSAFMLIDFLAHKFFYNITSTANLHPWQDQAKKIFTDLYGTLIQLERETALQPVASGTTKLEFLLLLKDNLEALCTYIENLNTEIPEEADLKNVLLCLKDYISCMPSANFPLAHIYSTLAAPINLNEAITELDLPIIKHHNALLNTHEIVEYLLKDLKNTCNQQLQSCSKAAKHFWQLNMTCISSWALAVQKMMKCRRDYKKSAAVCETPKEMIKILHQFQNNLGACRVNQYELQLTILNQYAEKQGILDIYNRFQVLFWILSGNSYIEKTLADIVMTNPLPINDKEPKVRAAASKHIQQEILLSSPSTEEYNETLTIKESYQPSNSIHSPSIFEQDLKLLRNIDDLPIQSLENESSIAFVRRQRDRHFLIQNNIFLLAAREEKKSLEDVDQNLLNRSELNDLLLLETTMKIGLIGERISTEHNQTTHILYDDSEKKLLHSHNVETLIQISKEMQKEWLMEDEVQKSICNLENNLKRAFWFEKNIVLSNVDDTTSSCRKVWIELASNDKDIVNLKLENHKIFKQNTFKFQRDFEINLNTLTSSVTFDSLREKIHCAAQQLTPDLQCTRQFKTYLKVIDRTIALGVSLEKYSLSKNMPIFVAVRSAEIQISLLSTVMKLALTTCAPKEDENHPLFLNENSSQKSRPLAFSHNPKILWKTLCNHLSFGCDEEIQEKFKDCLPLFCGDPRYPFPNKTPMTKDLVMIYKKALLLQKLKQDHFFDQKEFSQLTKYIGAENKQASKNSKIKLLENALLKDLEKQQIKMKIALDLANSILEMVSSQN